jgi:TfoX/Sxy family transcriptional regulator of competence genes
MEIPKPSDEDKARFRALVPDDPRVEVKPMFGNLGGFVNGNMFMGLFGSDIGVKLPAEELERVTQAGGGPFGPAERPMGGYVTLPVASGPAEQEEAVGAALAFVAAQPAKKPKKPTKAKEAAS